MAASIFCQIASYRDPQLIPTLVDMIDQAAQPGALRVVVCWQHAPGETLGEFLAYGFLQGDTVVGDAFPVHVLHKKGAVIELIDVPHLKSKGACWARNLIQQHYKGETYTLQLDSHHRFVQGWDTILIEMLESLRGQSPKPILTTYLPDFNPENDPESRVMEPNVLTFSCFNVDGIVLPIDRKMPESERSAPVPGSFYSAHFAFADGSFATEVPHDPRLFFLGEEISIAVRAFTHGYDFYNPHRIVCWHRYTRAGRPSVWNDHSGTAKKRGDVEFDTAERHYSGLPYLRALMRIDGENPDSADLGAYGLGSVRSLADYEKFAGLLFAHRAVHRVTQIEGRLPTMTGAEGSVEWWAPFRRWNEVRIIDFSPEALSKWRTAAKGLLYFFDNDGVELYRETLDAAKLKACVLDGYAMYSCPFLTSTHRIPARYTFQLYDDAGECLQAKCPVTSWV